MAAAVAQALHAAGQPAPSHRHPPQEGDGQPMTDMTVAGAIARIDQMQAHIDQSDKIIVALVVENAKLRAQIAELKAIALLKDQR